MKTEGEIKVALMVLELQRDLAETYSEDRVEGQTTAIIKFAEWILKGKGE